MTDTHQFEAFMRSYQDMVYTTAIRLLGNSADAEDISQEVFLKAYARFDDLADNPAAGGWLRTVARNLCLNHLSRYRARWRFFSEMTSEGSQDDYVDSVAAPEDSASALGETDRRQLIEEALHNLPAAQRVALVLYHFEEMQYDQIAQRLGVSLSKVKTDIHRGRQALYHRLRHTMRENSSHSSLLD